MHLLALPTELRLAIYDQVFAAFSLDESHQRSHALEIEPPILQTCQPIRKEALKLYHRRIVEIENQAHHVWIEGFGVCEEIRSVGHGDYAFFLECLQRQRDAAIVLRVAGDERKRIAAELRA